MSALRRTLPLLLALLVAAVAAATGGAVDARTAPPAPPDQSLKRLERIVRDRVDTVRSTGIVAGMVLPDGRTGVVAYGKAGKGRRMDVNTVFEIGSITKVFTATVLADMVQRGEVQLSDPVASLLPPGVSAPSRNGRQITLEDLATHSSGLPREATNLRPKNLYNPYADYTVKQLYAFLESYKLPRDPGLRVEYSNVGEGLLGHALALRTGKSYEELVRERILVPLQMTSTGVTLTPKLARHAAIGHGPGGRVVPPFQMTTLAGAGALRSTIGDMLKFAQANLDGQAGPLQQAMASARAPRRQTPWGKIGLSWFTDHRIVWHNGGTVGFFSFIGLDEAHRTAIVVLSNSGWESVDDIGFHLLDERLPLTPARKEPKAITLPGKLLQRYVGVYVLAGIKLRITRGPLGLRIHAPRQGSARLYAKSRTTFFLKNVDAEIRITFRLTARGRVTGFVLRENGRARPARKIK